METIEVSATGRNDQENINAAIRSLPETGGRVLLAGGDYDIRKTKSGNPLGGVLIEDRQHITVEGVGDKTRLLLADNQGVNVIRGIGSGLSDITIKNLYIDANQENNNRHDYEIWTVHGSYELNGIRISSRTSMTQNPVRGIHVDSCVVRDANCLGIMCTGDVVFVTNNTVSDCASDCIEVLGRNAIVSGNTVGAYAGFAGHVGIGTDNCDNVLISDNTVECTDAHLDVGIRTWPDTEHTLITGNTIVCDKGTITKLMRLLGNTTYTVGNKYINRGGTITEKIHVKGDRVIIGDDW